VAGTSLAFSYNTNAHSLQNGFTPLLIASRFGHQKVVELLLGAGANPDLQEEVRATTVMELMTMSC